MSVRGEAELAVLVDELATTNARFSRLIVWLLVELSQKSALERFAIEELDRRWPASEERAA